MNLSWKTENDGKLLKLRWQEGGGPEVAEPTHRGFGSFIIEQSLSSVEGCASVYFERAGLVCEMQLPIKKPKAPGEANLPAAK